MSVKYNFDLSPQSHWEIATPREISYKLPFYVEFIGNYFTQINFFTERSNVMSYMAMFTVSGKGILTYNNQDHILSEGSIFIVDCNEYHYFKPITENWNYRWLHYNGIAAHTFYELLYSGSPHPIFCKDPALTEKIYENITELILVPSIYNEISISQELSTLLTSLVTEELILRNEPSNKYILSAIDYIENNYMNDIDIEQLAELVHLSKYYFIRLFKQCMGVSPYEHVINLRINKSKHLLMGTEMSINEIAESVGFNDESHFIRTFKRITKITPDKFRKQLL